MSEPKVEAVIPYPPVQPGLMPATVVIPYDQVSGPEQETNEDVSLLLVEKSKNDSKTYTVTEPLVSDDLGNTSLGNTFDIDPLSTFSKPTSALDSAEPFHGAKTYDIQEESVLHKVSRVKPKKSKRQLDLLRVKLEQYQRTLMKLRNDMLVLDEEVSLLQEDLLVTTDPKSLNKEPFMNNPD